VSPPELELSDDPDEPDEPLDDDSPEEEDEDDVDSDAPSFTGFLPLRP
jgi:hypothetical protein